MKTPGHAMTAQAGAVAVVPVEPTPEMLAEGRQVSQFETRKVGCIYRAMLAAAPTPPAAVPVEALEGLVAEWHEDAKRMHAAAMRAQKLGNEEASCSYLDAAKDARGYADELTQLIKERSNG